MIADLFWNVATSSPALALLGLILLAALVVGYTPLIQYVPVIGTYKPVGRLVSAIVAALICFLIGFRISDERETLKNLRATLERREADLAIASKSAADAQQRVKEIEASSDAQHQTDAQYIASLQANPACALSDSDLGPARGVRNSPPGWNGWHRARSPAGSR